MTVTLQINPKGASFTTITKVVDQIGWHVHGDEFYIDKIEIMGDKDGDHIIDFESAYPRLPIINFHCTIDYRFGDLLEFSDVVKHLSKYKFPSNLVTSISIGAPSTRTYVSLQQIDPDNPDDKLYDIWDFGFAKEEKKDE